MIYLYIIKIFNHSTQHNIYKPCKVLLNICITIFLLKNVLFFCNNFKIKSSFYCLTKAIKLVTQNSKRKIQNYLYGNFFRRVRIEKYKIMPVA